MPEPEKLIAQHGGYRKLKSFQVAQLAYDVTVRFCERYIDRKSRTRDQMVQAARSGVQNIAEGSQASGTSRKTELKLTNVARASLEAESDETRPRRASVAKLRLDYEDFLRQRALPLWTREDPRRAELIARRCSTAEQVADWVRQIHDGQGGPGGQASAQPSSTPSTPSTASPPPIKSTSSTPSTKSTRSTYQEIAANAALVLIAVAVSLLDRQLAAQAEAFEKDGGFTERLYRVRSQKRNQP